MSWCCCGTIRQSKNVSRPLKEQPTYSENLFRYMKSNPTFVFLVHVMQFPQILFLLASSTTSIIATPVGEDPNFQSGVTLFSSPLDLDLSKDSTNQPFPEVASSKPASQLLATNDDSKDMAFQDSSKQFDYFPQGSADDFSNIAPVSLFSTNSPPVPPLGQQPATANSPGRVDVPSQPLSKPGGSTMALPTPPLPPVTPKNGPDCKGWHRLCCYGNLWYDDDGYLSIDHCYPCNDSSFFFYFFFPRLSIALKSAFTPATGTNRNLFSDSWYPCEHPEIIYCCFQYVVSHVPNMIPLTKDFGLALKLLILSFFIPFCLRETDRSADELNYTSAVKVCGRELLLSQR